MKILLRGQLAPTALLVGCLACLLKASTAAKVDSSDARSHEALQINISARARITKDLPEQYHYKQAGNGYMRGSPLFGKQRQIATGSGVHSIDGASTRVSTTTKCIIFLLFQFFIVYTALFIVETIKTFRPRRFTRAKQVLRELTKSIYMIPMLCVLFLATRMRAVQLSKGMTEYYNLPQFYVRTAMLVCAIAHLLRAATDVVLQALSRQTSGESIAQMPMPREGRRQKALKVVFYVITVVHHISFMVICWGLCTMPAPKELWGYGGGPKASVAIFCTILLLMLFFVVHFSIDLVQMTDVLTSQGTRFSRLANSTLIRDLPSTVDIIPMLCVLFMACRIRSWQLSGSDAEGWPRWAKTSAYVATFSVFAMVSLKLALAILRKDVPPSNVQADSEANTKLGKITTLMRLAMLLTLCTSAVLIILALSLYRMPTGGQTPAMPSSLQCVLVLSTLYFLFYCGKYLLETVKLYIEDGKKEQPSRKAQKVEQVKKLLAFLEDHSKQAIDFCPVLCALFLATFLRALQLTDGKGAPQRWAQHWMYVATWAIIFMTIARVDSLLFPQAPQPALASTESKPTRAQYFFKLLLCFSMFLLHLAAFFIIFAVFTMTPTNAHGRGSIDVI